MDIVDHNHWIENDHQQIIVDRAGQLAKRFADRANQHDREGSFPFENFDELKEAGFLALTIPKEYGGGGISLYEFLLVQERLGRGDASTALGLGWHLGILMNLRETRAVEENIYSAICKDVVTNGALINSLATEPETGSPSRGGMPQTTAKRLGDTWVLNGRKTWSTLSPALTYFLITAGIEGEDARGEYLVYRDTPGLTIEETWDSLGMRATSSHDVVLNDVKIPADQLLHKRTTGETSAKSMDGGGWLLHIPACYIGVATAARDFAVTFAREYQPNSLDAPIAEVPQVRMRIGEMELDLHVAKTMLYSVAKRWDLHSGARMSIKPDLALAKHVATNAAVRIVDQAMRIVGGRSLLKKYPLERYYRDVRAGLHNPPMDDVTIQMLAKRALEAD